MIDLLFLIPERYFMGPWFCATFWWVCLSSRSNSDSDGAEESSLAFSASSLAQAACSLAYHFEGFWDSILIVALLSGVVKNATKGR
jgi:hypothetical protein